MFNAPRIFPMAMVNMDNLWSNFVFEIWCTILAMESLCFVHGHGHSQNYNHLTTVINFYRLTMTLRCEPNVQNIVVISTPQTSLIVNHYYFLNIQYDMVWTTVIHLVIVLNWLSCTKSSYWGGKNFIYLQFTN